MSDTIDAKDLARFHLAQKEATEAQRQASEAQKVAAEAQARAIAARGAVDFLSRQLTGEYALTPTDTVNLDTGQITRAHDQRDGPSMQISDSMLRHLTASKAAAVNE